jgi:hypothetical protein
MLAGARLDNVVIADVLGGVRIERGTEVELETNELAMLPFTSEQALFGRKRRYWSR